MSKSFRVITSSFLVSTALMQAPSLAQERVSDRLEIYNVTPNGVNVLGDPVTQGVYRKPNAYHAELSDLATRATRADSAAIADRALSADRADLAVRLEEKLPFGQAWTFGLNRSSAGSRRLTQDYVRPSGADAVLVHANCDAAAGSGTVISRVTISFNAGFTRSMTLCDGARTSGGADRAQYNNAVNLDIPQGATKLRVTQYIEKSSRSYTASTDGFIQWFGPYSLQATSQGPTTISNQSTSSSSGSGSTSGSSSGSTSGSGSGSTSSSSSSGGSNSNSTPPAVDPQPPRVTNPRPPAVDPQPPQVTNPRPPADEPQPPQVTTPQPPADNSGPGPELDCLWIGGAAIGCHPVEMDTSSNPVDTGPTQPDNPQPPQTSNPAPPIQNTRPNFGGCDERWQNQRDRFGRPTLNAC